jgi:hypothetical protein
MITFTEQEVMSHLTKDGELYILFDPISMSDLGESKNFAVNLNERKKILSDYKAGRTYSTLYYDTIELYRKYFLYKGDKIKLVYSDEYEADDFVEPLLKQFEDEWVNETGAKSVALCTTDYDFSKYISSKPKRKVDMINNGFNSPFSTEQFEAMFQFQPSPTANTIYKSLFGDQSDNITGALFMKKVKFNVNIKTIARDYIKDINANKWTLDDVIKQFKTATFANVNKKADKTPFDMLYLNMSVIDLKVPILEKFYTNIKVIKSALQDKDIAPYVHNNPLNAKFNDIVYQSIFGKKFTTIFGKN